MVPFLAGGALLVRLVLIVNYGHGASDHLVMDKPQRHRKQTLRQWVRIILLTALLLAVETGYVDLNNEPLPDQSPVTQTVSAQH